jgi:DNA-binding Lrp family transcriptional regulator
MAGPTTVLKSEMDELDRKLVTLLRHDGRRSLSDLALDLGLSRATIRGRLERLRKSGEILGFTVVLPGDVAELPVRGIMLVEIEGRVADNVIKALDGFHEVTAVHTTNGKWDLVVELATADLAAFDRVLRQIRLVPGITGTETNLLLATRRSSKARH